MLDYIQLSAPNHDWNPQRLIVAFKIWPKFAIRAQRFQRVHELEDQRQRPPFAARIPQTYGVPRIEARGVRAMRGVRADEDKPSGTQLI